ncbi:MAG: hypothetical protein MJH08_19465, partial [Hyphomicrobiales bacterium]|nr:hypothetical protein [Hyphomicrobiales bacterium]
MVDSNFTCRTAANAMAWAGAVVLSLIAPFGSTAHADPIVPPSSACVSTDGVTIVCTGDLTEGIRVDTVGGPVDTYRILQVKEATGRIEPAERIDGVFFKTEKRNLTIDIDDVDIVTNGYQADGIDAFIATGAGEYEPGVEDTVDLIITHAG